MAKTKKQEPIVDNETGSIKVAKNPTLETNENQTEGNVTKVKSKMTAKAKAEESTVIKVDLSQPSKSDEKPTEVVEQVIEEITDATEPKLERSTQPQMPESIQKVVSFMEETGGDLQDYMNLNKDFNSYGDDDLLTSYYKETKPHLNDDEISFLVQDSFDWNENIDDEKDVMRKKLALKEQVVSAKNHLDGLKSKYYEDIKMGSKLTDEQQDAIKFFNESKERHQSQEQAQSAFLNKTEEVFNKEFKGFEYEVGDKKFRYNVGDTEKLKTTQSDINNFVGKFLNNKNEMENAAGYHKGLFTAMNSDAIANHFYEQGKADALKQSMAKSKNINMDPRQSYGAEVQSGTKYRVLGDASPDYKFKIKKRK
tara:strand:- start:1015 stop:2115 length:1101 start_codon:yes stop_codon:yes gene_type:complete